MPLMINYMTHTQVNISPVTQSMAQTETCKEIFEHKRFSCFVVKCFLIAGASVGDAAMLIVCTFLVGDGGN